jgi:hypothetical protein
MDIFGCSIRAHHSMKKLFTERHGMREPRVKDEGAAPPAIQ